jgi:hypothetical protein
MNYKTEGLEVSEKERIYSEIWRYSYSARHLHLIRYRESSTYEEILDAVDFIEELYLQACGQCISNYTDHEELETFKLELINFSGRLLYAYHRINYNDGYKDFWYEASLTEFSKHLKLIPRKSLHHIQTLHQQSYKFGFVITALLLKPDYKPLRRLFLYAYPKDPDTLPTYDNFIFPKRNKKSDYIQFSVYPYTPEITNNWDLVIFYNPDHTIDHIRKELNKVWKNKSEQSLGDKNSYSIAVYIDRKSCTKTHAMNALELQISWSYFGKDGGFIVAPEFNNKMQDKAPTIHCNYSKSTSKKLLKAIKLAESQYEKRWDIQKNNTRRDIALMHWDIWNDTSKNSSPYVSKNALYRSTISELRENKPSVLDLYSSKYNKLQSKNGTSIFGDTSVTEATVVREMAEDYALTEYCIENSDYFRPQEAKNKKTR